MVEQKDFESHFIECLTKNFGQYSPYLEFEYKVFFELRTTVYQITKCLILELNYATITLTNYTLERLLKLALIFKEVGIRPIPTENWNSVFGIADQKYGSLTLANSIEQCKKEKLITESEKNTLFNTVRELMRNGFSHADAGKVLVNIPDSQPLVKANINRPTEIEEITLNPKVIPTLQYIHIEMFAKQNASKYFEYVFRLIGNIENRIKEMDKA